MSKSEMTLWEHLEELRRRLAISFVVLVLFTIVSYVYWDFILKILVQPVGSRKLVYLNVMEPFIARFKLALWTGLIVSFPIILYEIIRFTIPGLKKSEKRFTLVIVCLLCILFYSGIFFGYKFVLKVGISWLESQGAGLLQSNLTVSAYVSFVGFFLLAFGVSFETPLVVILLTKMGFVQPKQLIKHWRISVVIILVFSAIITPDWSPVTMGLMAIPMLVLYFMGVGVSYIFAIKDKKKLSVERPSAS